MLSSALWALLMRTGRLACRLFKLSVASAGLESGFDAIKVLLYLPDVVIGLLCLIENALAIRIA